MKNKRAILLLFSAHMISSFAQGITMLAIPWYFTTIAGEPGLFGKVLAVATAFSIFWSLYAGTLIDRYPRRNIFWFSAFAGLVCMGSISAYGYAEGHMLLELVAAAFVVTFFGYNIHYPNLYAFTQELAAKGDYGRVNAMIEVAGQSTSVLSGAVGAVLLSGTGAGSIDLMGLHIGLPFEVARWELWEIFALDAATYLAAVCIIPFIRYQRMADLVVDTEPVLARLRQGIHFLTANRTLMYFGLSTYAIFIVILVHVMYLLPMYIDHHLLARADAYASSEVYFALGSLAAGLFIRSLTKRMAPARSILLLMAAAGGLFLLAASVRSMAFFYLFSLLIGFCNAGTRVLRVTFLFNHIPNNIIGRANSIFYLYNILSRSAFLSLFALPFFATDGNITWAYAICGVFILSATVPLYRVVARLDGGDVVV